MHAGAGKRVPSISLDQWTLGCGMLMEKITSYMVTLIETRVGV